MPNANDFLILAARDYTLCCKVEEDFPQEYAVTAACFHMQQAIEKQLKALILSSGETTEFTHNITKLANRCEDLGIELPEKLDDIADTLTMWESSCRNDPSIVFSEKEYSKAKSVYSDLKIQISNMLSGINCDDNNADEIEDGESDGLQPMM